MAMKFRRVKRRRRSARRNPAKMNWLMWGALAAGIYYFVRRSKAKTAAVAAPRLTAQIAPPPTAADPSELSEIRGGGVLASKGSHGSLS